MKGRAIAEVDAFHQVELDLGAEILGMLFHAFNQFRTAQAIGKSGIILDLVGDGDLPAKLTAGDNQRRQLSPGGVKRGGQASWSRADDDNTFLLHSSYLISNCVIIVSMKSYE